MSIAKILLDSCVNIFGKEIPTYNDILRYGGILIDSSSFVNTDKNDPFSVYIFKDGSQLLIEGKYTQKTSAW